MASRTSTALALGVAFPFFPERAASGALEVDLIYFALLAFAVLFIVAIFTTIAVFAIRYRAGSDADRSDPVATNVKLELIWIVIPTILSLVLFAWAAKAYLDLSQPPSDAHTVYVVGKQWMWKIQHPEGRREINQLHIPVGTPIRLLLTSQDVIHSFFVPAFRVKQDALPDRYTTLWFKADRVGTYDLFCAEYCGAGHSNMRGRVVVMTPGAFERWLGAGSETPPAPGEPGTPHGSMALAGRGPFFTHGCNACHLPSASVRAPRLDGLAGSAVRLKNGSTVIADEAYLRESILEPQAKIVAGYDSPSLMPTYRGQIDEEELNQLVEMIKSLKNGWPEQMLEKPQGEE